MPPSTHPPSDVPVPYEVVKQVDVPVPVEQIVEKIVQVPVQVEKRVCQEVQVPYPVQKIVEVPVPYQVETIVHTQVFFCHSSMGCVHFWRGSFTRVEASIRWLTAGGRF